MEAKTLVMRAIDEYGIRLKPKLDQHLLIDDKVIADLILQADIRPGMRILEIGLGAGQITRKLLQQGSIVYGYEIDRRFEPLLQEIDDSNFHLIIGDAFKYDWPTCDRIVANLPFTLTETLAQRLIKIEIERIAAIFGSQTVHLFRRREAISKLKLMFESRFEVFVHSDIPQSAFLPQPPQSAAIITLKRREKFKGGPRMQFWQTFFSRPDTSVFLAIQSSLPKLKRGRFLTVYDFHLPKNILSMRAGSLSNQYIVDIDKALRIALGKKGNPKENWGEIY